MYYLKNSENDANVKTNSLALAEYLVAEQGYVRTWAWKQRIVALLKDWAQLTIAVLAAAYFVRYALAPDYAYWSHFVTAAIISAVLYDWLRGRFP